MLGAQRLNLDLSGLGAPGCRLYTDILLLFPSATNASGGLILGVPLPPELLHVTYYTQFAVFAPSANSLSLVYSEGAKSITG